MGLLPGALVKVNAGQLLMTMVYTIVLPFLIHLPLRKLSRVRNIIARYNALFTLLGLGTIFIAATARNKPAILGNPGVVGLYAVMALLLYFILYLTGYSADAGQITPGKTHHVNQLRRKQYRIGSYHYSFVLSR